MSQAFAQDLELAERLRNRDAAAARELFGRVGEEMFGFAFRMLRDRGETEDVLQETMLGVLQSIGRYDGRVALRSWIYGILRNKIADAMRKRGRNLAISTDDPEALYFDARGHWLQEYEFAPFNENAELLEIVRKCMEELPFNQREALELRAVKGLSSQEAAEALQVSNTNLRQILHRARQNVRRCVAAKSGEELQ